MASYSAATTANTICQF